MRLRRQGPAQSRQGVPDAASLRRAWPHARAWRQRSVPRNPAVLMTDILRARDEQDVSEAVARALAEERTLEIVGQGTKRAIGRAAQTDMTLDLSRLSGIEL